MALAEKRTVYLVLDVITCLTFLSAVIFTALHIFAVLYGFLPSPALTPYRWILSLLCFPSILRRTISTFKFRVLSFLGCLLATWILATFAIALIGYPFTTRVIRESVPILQIERREAWTIRRIPGLYVADNRGGKEKIYPPSGFLNLVKTGGRVDLIGREGPFGFYVDGVVRSS